MNGDSAGFGRLAGRLEAERDAAGPLVEMIALDPARYLDAALPPDWYTMGMVDRLTTAAREELERSPERSAQLAQLALAIAGMLAETYPRVLRAQAEALAWKELSNAHRYRSDYPAALRALDKGDACLEPEPALGHDRAVLLLARALTLRELNQPTDALAALEEAVETFRDYGDPMRLAQCELAAGIIHHRRGDRASARKAFMRVIGAARAAGDLHTVAAAYNNLGQAAAESGETSAAMDALLQARAIFTDLEMPGEVARVTWGIGSALLTASRFEEAVRFLEQARGGFVAVGMPEEAGLAGIEMAEALLAMNARGRAHDIIVSVIEEFRAAQLSERALQAVAYLRDTADAASPATARQVRNYVERVKEEPALLFLPLEM